MSKAIYTGVGGIARKVPRLYVGVDGVARKVKKGYVGVNGVARLFYSGGGSGLLPSGYTELEYLIIKPNTVDRMYINFTDKSLSAKVRAVLDIKFNILPSAYIQSIGRMSLVGFSSQQTGKSATLSISRNHFSSTSNNSAWYKVKIGGDDSVAEQLILGNRNRVIIDFNLQAAYLGIKDLSADPYSEDAYIKKSISASGDLEPISGWTLFYGYEQEPNHQELWVYDFKLYDGGTLVQWLIPCKNTIGAVGFFDVIEMKFFKSNSGNYVAGPEA